MYFITEQDPNYTVKGSLDPLGFQVIWQEAGRKLIPYLSTVSSNIRDFQVLCLAYAARQQLDIAEASFGSFFIRFEQLMAYTRYRQNPAEGFNGIDKVRKILSSNQTTVRISNSQTDQILSNQRAKITATNRLDFDNLVQVFYPYLPQSVEVNQVIELLKNVNKFVETFNEIEVQNVYKTSVRIDQEVQTSDIPEQITDRLKSLYDVTHFKTD